MKRVYTLLALLSVMTLLPRCATAQGFGGADGDFATSSGVTPMDFLGQADGCPYTAMALYQQYTQQTRLAGRNSGGDSRINQAAGNPGSSSNSFSSVGTGSKKKKKTTTKVTQSPKTKNGSSTSRARPGSTTADTAKGKPIAKDDTTKSS
jgi:hypothetical protein